MRVPGIVDCSECRSTAEACNGTFARACHCGTNRRCRRQLTAHRQHRIPQALGIETTRLHAPEEYVVGINLHRPVISSRTQLVNTTRDEVLDQPLDAPSILYESNGKVVQQFRVRRLLASQAEIIRRWYQSASEQLQPDSIHHNARGQWVAPTCDPVGKFQTTTACGSDHERFCADDLKSPARDTSLARLIGFTTDINGAVIDRFHTVVREISETTPTRTQSKPRTCGRWLVANSHGQALRPTIYFAGIKLSL